MLRNLSLVLLAVAYVSLYPGLTQPLLDIAAYVDNADLAEIGKDIIVNNPDTPELIGTMAQVLVDNMAFEGTVQAYGKTRSIAGTVKELYDSSHVMVAFLVALFSIIIPVVKGLLLIAGALTNNPSAKNQLSKFTSVISKWSMADVFVVGVFVAFLAANAIENEGGFLTFQAILGPGFYFFLGYCLLSNLSSQLLLLANRKSPAHPH